MWGFDSFLQIDDLYFWLIFVWIFEYDKTWNFFFQVNFFFVKIAVKRKNALGRTARICIWFFNNFGIYTCINHLKKSRKPQETTENLVVLSSKIINKIFRSENKNCLKQRFFSLSLYTWNGDGWSKIDKVQ